MRNLDIWKFVESTDYLSENSLDTINVDLERLNMSGKHKLFKKWFDNLGFDYLSTYGRPPVMSDDFFDEISLDGHPYQILGDLQRLNTALIKLEAFNKSSILQLPLNYWSE